MRRSSKLRQREPLATQRDDTEVKGNASRVLLLTHIHDIFDNLKTFRFHRRGQSVVCLAALGQLLALVRVGSGRLHPES